MLFRLFLIGLIAGLSPLVLRAQDVPAPWTTDLVAAMKKSEDTKAPMAVLFTTGWSPPSKALLEKVLPKADVAKAFDGHVCALVDGDGNASAVAAHKVSAYPTLVFLDAAGKETRRLTQIATTPEGFIAQVKGGAKAAPAAKKAAPAATGSNPAAIAALEMLATQAYTMTARVSREEAEAEGGMMMMMPGMGKGGQPFEGTLHLRRHAEGDVLVASKSALPGVVLYGKGSNRMQRATTRTGSDIALGDLQNDLAPFFAVDGVLKWAQKKAKWKSATKEDGKSSHRTTLPARFFETATEDEDDGMGMGGMMVDPFAVKILRGELKLTLDAQGGLIAVDLHVVRNDPMAALQEMMEEGGGEMGIDPSALAEMDPIDGGVSRYAFKPADAGKIARLDALATEFRGLTK